MSVSWDFYEKNKPHNFVSCYFKTAIPNFK